MHTLSATTISLTASDGHQLDAWRIQPAGRPRGGLVLAHERSAGDADGLRSFAEELAEDGYAVLVPGLSDQTAGGPGIRRDAELAQRDLAAALRALTMAGRAAVVGDGALALLAGARLRVAAAVGYADGSLTRHPVVAPQVPLLLHVAGQDDGRISGQLPQAEVHAYPGAQTGFHLTGRAEHDAQQARTAHRRTVEFLARHLG